MLFSLMLLASLLAIDGWNRENLAFFPFNDTMTAALEHFLIVKMMVHQFIDLCSFHPEGSVLLVSPDPINRFAEEPPMEIMEETRI